MTARRWHPVGVTIVKRYKTVFLNISVTAGHLLPLSGPHFVCALMTSHKPKWDSPNSRA